MYEHEPSFHVAINVDVINDLSNQKVDEILSHISQFDFVHSLIELFKPKNDFDDISLQIHALMMQVRWKMSFEPIYWQLFGNFGN